MLTQTLWQYYNVNEVRVILRAFGRLLVYQKHACQSSLSLSVHTSARRVCGSHIHSQKVNTNANRAAYINSNIGCCYLFVVVMLKRSTYLYKGTSFTYQILLKSNSFISSWSHLTILYQKIQNFTRLVYAVALQWKPNSFETKSAQDYLLN